MVRSIYEGKSFISVTALHVRPLRPRVGHLRKALVSSHASISRQGPAPATSPNKSSSDHDIDTFSTEPQTHVERTSDPQPSTLASGSVMERAPFVSEEVIDVRPSLGDADDPADWGRLAFEFFVGDATGVLSCVSFSERESKIVWTTTLTHPVASIAADASEINRSGIVVASGTSLLHFDAKGRKLSQFDTNLARSLKFVCASPNGLVHVCSDSVYLCFEREKEVGSYATSEPITSLCVLQFFEDGVSVALASEDQYVRIIKRSQSTMEIPISSKPTSVTTGDHSGGFKILCGTANSEIVCISLSDNTYSVLWTVSAFSGTFTRRESMLGLSVSITTLQRSPPFPADTVEVVAGREDGALQVLLIRSDGRASLIHEEDLGSSVSNGVLCVDEGPVALADGDVAADGASAPFFVASVFSGKIYLGLLRRGMLDIPLEPLSQVSLVELESANAGSLQSLKSLRESTSAVTHQRISLGPLASLPDVSTGLKPVRLAPLGGDGIPHPQFRSVSPLPSVSPTRDVPVQLPQGNEMKSEAVSLVPMEEMKGPG
ncbi:Bardet-Biedl syndrome 7 protein [Phlyctochytrium bullatum]|nr:Bardet-Biedl syndrome 7 protein [Phlyctochytrium bullatum]